MSEAPPKLDYDASRRPRTPSAEAAFLLNAMYAFIATAIWIVLCYLGAIIISLITQFPYPIFTLALGSLFWVVIFIAYSMDQFESSGPNARHRGIGTLIGLALGFLVHGFWIVVRN